MTKLLTNFVLPVLFIGVLAFFALQFTGTIDIRTWNAPQLSSVAVAALLLAIAIFLLYNSKKGGGWLLFLAAILFFGALAYQALGPTNVDTTFKNIGSTLAGTKKGAPVATPATVLASSNRLGVMNIVVPAGGRSIDIFNGKTTCLHRVEPAAGWPVEMYRDTKGNTFTYPKKPKAGTMKNLWFVSNQPFDVTVHVERRLKGKC